LNQQFQGVLKFAEALIPVEVVSGGVKMYKKCRFENAGKKRAVFQATGASRLPETG